MKKLAFKKKNGMNFIDYNDIIFIEKFDRKIVIHTKDNSFKTSGTLTSIFEKLDKEIFFRSHRSYIINLNYISKIIPWGEKSYRIMFKQTKEDALFSYDRYKKFKDNFI